MKVKVKLSKEQLRKKLGIIDPTPLDVQALETSILSKVPPQVPFDPKPITDEINVVRDEVRSRARATGAKGIQLYVDGSRKGLTSQAINIIGGNGVTLTYSYSNGRNDITVSTSGGGFLAATGTVDGSNLEFTFTSAPSIIVVDGVPRQKTQSDTTVNWTGTTTVTLLVAPNFDIYGIA